jgi:hypothetical protein
MFDGTALRGFVNTLTVDTIGLTDSAAVTTLIRTATDARNRVLGGSPRPTSYRQIVDGIDGASLTSVRPDGEIIFAWQYLEEVVRDIYDQLIASAPRDTGAYIKGVRVLLDGTVSSLDAITADTRQVVIVPSVPYARRLEVGLRDGGGKFVLQVPLHNVELIAKMASTLYGSLASIDFAFVDLPDAYEHGRKPREWRHRAPRVSETHVRYPAIVITPRTA